MQRNWEPGHLSWTLLGEIHERLSYVDTRQVLRDANTPPGGRRAAAATDAAIEAAVAMPAEHSDYGGDPADALPGSNITGHGFAKGKAARGARSGAWMTPRVVLDRALAVVCAVAGPESDGWDPAWALDAAAEPGSACAGRWYGPGSLLRADALTPEPWSLTPRGAGGPVWLNPPYGAVRPFADRALVEAERLWIGWLSYARTDTRAFQRLWWSPHLAAFAFLPGRVRFVDPTTGQQGTSAPAPSVFMVLGPSPSRPPIRVRW